MAAISRRTLLSLAAGAPLLRSQISTFQGRSIVSLVRGEDRRRNVYNALLAIDDQIRPVLKRKKYVLLKPNTVAVNNQLGMHARRRLARYPRLSERAPSRPGRDRRLFQGLHLGRLRELPLQPCAHRIPPAQGQPRRSQRRPAPVRPRNRRSRSPPDAGAPGLAPVRPRGVHPRLRHSQGARQRRRHVCRSRTW